MGIARKCRSRLRAIGRAPPILPARPHNRALAQEQTTDMSDASRFQVAVIGGGPAGLMAAEVLARGGAAVTVYDRMPSVGRKLLLAGRGGLNLTHSEDVERLLGRYGGAQPHLRPAIEAFSPAALRAWCEGLGQ